MSVKKESHTSEAAPRRVLAGVGCGGRDLLADGWDDVADVRLHALVAGHLLGFFGRERDHPCPRGDRPAVRVEAKRALDHAILDRRSLNRRDEHSDSVAAEDASAEPPPFGAHLGVVSRRDLDLRRVVVPGCSLVGVFVREHALVRLPGTDIRQGAKDRLLGWVDGVRAAVDSATRPGVGNGSHHLGRETTSPWLFFFHLFLCTLSR